LSDPDFSRGIRSLHAVLAETRHESEIVSSLKTIAAFFGADHGYFVMRRSPDLTDKGVRRFITYGVDVLDVYWKRKSLSFDPLVRQWQKDPAPFDHDELDWSDERATELRKALKDAGFGPSGLSMSIHGPCGLWAAFGVVSPKQPAPWSDWIVEAKCIFAGLGLALFNTVKIITHHRDFDVVSLTKRETECLEWSARGKTIAETAIILGLAPTSVRHLLDDARQKLGAVTKAQAVARAQELRLLRR
jgi:DNA-binding CsgD family transcriptional regulator